MQITFDTDKDSPERIRAVAEFVGTLDCYPELPQPDAPPPITDAESTADLAGEPRPSSVEITDGDDDSEDANSTPVTIRPGSVRLVVPPEQPPELDAAGEPWDPNLHASSKAKLKNGRWRLRRGGPAKPAADAPPPPAAPVVPPPPPAPAEVPPVPEGPTFRTLVALIVAARNEDRLSDEKIAEIVTAAGAPDLQSLAAMPALIPAVYDTVTGYLEIPF
jgi:hypothetical protein